MITIKSMVSILVFLILHLTVLSKHYAEDLIFYFDHTQTPYSINAYKDLHLSNTIKEMHLPYPQKYSVEMIQESDQNKNFLLSNEITTNKPGYFFALDNNNNILKYNVFIQNKFNLTTDLFEKSNISFIEPHVIINDTFFPINIIVKKGQLLPQGIYESKIKINILEYDTKNIIERLHILIKIEVKKDYALKVIEKFYDQHYFNIRFKLLSNTPLCLTFRNKKDKKNLTPHIISHLENNKEKNAVCIQQSLKKNKTHLIKIPIEKLSNKLELYIKLM